MLERMPYLTADVPGLGGRIKAHPSDFQVEEVPLYPASGEGTHTYFCVEKTGLSTMRAVREIARALGVAPRDIGYAGLKDADAVTRQFFSVEHVPPERLQALHTPRIRIVWTGRHTNKLKLGHLKGNRFVLRVREAEPGRLADARAVLERLARYGVPNYFGEQRFGMRGDTWELGRAIVAGDLVEMIHIMLGRPCEKDYGDVRKARQLFDQGRYEEAAKAWPYAFRDERRAAQEMARTRGMHRRAFAVIDRGTRQFYLCAFQSYLFNQVVAERIGSLNRLREGDLAWRHANGAVFRVDDPAVEQPRADAFEISPSGPLFGYRMSEPDGETAAAERRVLEAAGLTHESWRNERIRVKGARRPLRFQPAEWDVSEGTDERGPYYEFRFFLESGCYATMVLREVCKTRLGESEE